MGSTIAFVPLIAIAGGVLAGMAVAWYLGIKGVLWLLGLLSVTALILIVRLAMIGPGDEADAFLPFIALTGGVLPALFGATLGGVTGRALSRRSGRS